ncbi:FMN-binding protein [Streptomyces minutiscleroticus]|uniref:FMN-binding protein n=1 Tax=Streptomyces minutiscleroticus TaxID=68238 RepID=UPI00331807EE
MKRALPVLILTVAGLVPLWRYEPSAGTAATAQPAAPAPAPSPTSSSGASSGASSSSGDAPRTVQGTAVDTEKGTVQVEVVFEGDRIGSVRMLQQPNHPQTTAAVPTLIEETLQAQSADIDTVSGATITSEGYRESLQAALDAKGA